MAVVRLHALRSMGRVVRWLKCILLIGYLLVCLLIFAFLYLF